MFKIIKRYMAPAMSAMTIAFALASCSADDPDFPGEAEEPATEAPQKETTKVGLTLSLGSDWNIDLGDGTDTRALPPGTGNNQQKEEPVDGSAELAAIDKVRVITFRRLDPDEAAPEQMDELARASFVYDSTNDLLLEEYRDGGKPDPDLFPENVNHTSHRLFTGEITKMMGFEYRIVAIAYSDKTATQFGASGISGLPAGDSDKFALNLTSGLTLEEFEANLNDRISLTSGTWRDFFNGTLGNTNTNSLGDIIVETPQFFYGECTAATGSSIIKYAEKDDNGDLVKNTPIRGILYRGVAKIEVQIEKVSQTKYAAITCNPQWVALMTDKVPLTVSLDNYDRFLLPNTNVLNKGYVPIAFTNTSSNKSETIETYILPCAARLALRIRYEGGLYNLLRNGQLWAKDTETGGNATGVISPDSHDGVYYLRRNHKYVIKVKDSENIMKNYSFN